MSETRLYRMLSRLMDIKPGEERIAVLLFMYFFLTTAPYTIIKTIRYTWLLEKMGIEGLPWGYLLAALATGLVVILRQKIESRLTAERLTLLSLAFFTITGLLFWMFLNAGGKMLSLLYWIWAYVLIVVLMTHFWLTVNQVFNPREAKRLIGFFGSGGLLGGACGGLLVYFFKSPSVAPYLLLLACGMLFACIFVAKAIFRAPRKQPAPPRPEEPTKESGAGRWFGLRDSFKTVLGNRYLMLISGLVMLTVIVSTFIDMQFMEVSQNLYPNRLPLQGFLGLFFASLNFFAFFVQLLLTGRFLKDFGIRLSLIFAPIILGILSLGFFFAFGTLLSAILLKGGDESIEFSIGQSARELLYIPVPRAIKSKAKVFIDMFVKRFAKAIASGLLALFGLFFSLRYVTIPVLALLVLWVFISFHIYREYRRAIKRNIEKRIPGGHEIVAERLDVDFTKQMFDTLAARDRSELLFAMHVFELLKEDRLTPDVKRLIAQKTEEVKASSLGGFFDAEGANWNPGEEVEEVDRSRLVDDISEIVSLPEYQQLIDQHAAHVLERSREAEIDKMELAKAIGLMKPENQLTGRLEALILDDSPDVARYAMESASRLLKPEHVHALILRLAHPLTREDAAAALCRYGEEALGPLADHLQDRRKKNDQRRAAADALARIGTQGAADILNRELDSGTDEIDDAVIEALDRIRTKSETVQFSIRIIHGRILEISREYCRTYLDRHTAPIGKPGDANADRLDRRMAGQMKNLFRLLGLIYPWRDINQAYQNLMKGTRRDTAYAAELLDNTLRKNHRDIIFPMIEDLSSVERARRFRQILKTLPKT